MVAFDPGGFYSIDLGDDLPKEAWLDDLWTRLTVFIPMPTGTIWVSLYVTDEIMSVDVERRVIAVAPTMLPWFRECIQEQVTHTLGNSGKSGKPG